MMWARDQWQIAPDELLDVWTWERVEVVQKYEAEWQKEKSR